MVLEPVVAGTCCTIAQMLLTRIVLPVGPCVHQYLRRAIPLSPSSRHTLDRALEDTGLRVGGN